MAKYLNSDGLAHFLEKLKPLIDAKADANHTHRYAGSGSAGGSANSAVKLDTTTAGSATQPVYFTGGKPVATTYTLGKSVPSNAVFTDTWRGIQNNLTSDSTTDSLSAAQGKALDNKKIDKISWTANIKCKSWSRICYVPFYASVIGSSFILNIKGTRSNVVYNETFCINSNHSSKCTINKIGSSSYTDGDLWIRGLADGNGNCYIDIWDEINDATTSTTQNIACFIIPISTGKITTYSAYTDGSGTPSGYTPTSLEVSKESFQGTITQATTATTATTASNALKLNGFQCISKSTAFSRIPYIDEAGVIELGTHIDLHYGNKETADYTSRISTTNGDGVMEFQTVGSINKVAYFTTQNETASIGFKAKVKNASEPVIMGYIGFNVVNGRLCRFNTAFKEEYKIHDTSSIKYGTAVPSGEANDGDIYIQIS